MSVIPQVVCKRCGKEFSALRPRCPYCGTRRVKTGDRVPMTTSSQNRGTPAAERAVLNTRWQMIFGLILLAAVVLAVIVLVTVGLQDANVDEAAAPQNTPIANTAAPTSEPEEGSASSSPSVSSPSSPSSGASDTSGDSVGSVPSPTPDAGAVQSISLTFLGSPRTEFAAGVGDEVTLKAVITPSSEKEVVWESADPSIATVNDGVVKGVKSGTTTISATCDGVTAKCTVYVTG